MKVSSNPSLLCTFTLSQKIPCVFLRLTYYITLDLRHVRLHVGGDHCPILFRPGPLDVHGRLLLDAALPPPTREARNRSPVAQPTHGSSPVSSWHFNQQKLCRKCSTNSELVAGPFADRRRVADVDVFHRRRRRRELVLHEGPRPQNAARAPHRASDHHRDDPLGGRISGTCQNAIYGYICSDYPVDET